MHQADQIVHMIENFGKAVLQKRPVQPPAEEAVRTLRVLDALARSAREQRVVAVE
jgi:predicted dehydrogenase